MACNSSFNVFNILLRILSYVSLSLMDLQLVFTINLGKRYISIILLICYELIITSIEYELASQVNHSR